MEGHRAPRGDTGAIVKAARLMNRSALITGASRGLGLATAVAFAREGADLWLVGRERAALAEAAARVAAVRLSVTQTISQHAVDVSNSAAMDPVIHQWLAARASVHVLVNNAAVQGPIGEVGATDWHTWRAALEIDLIAPIRLCHLVAPHMRAARRGKIINVSGGGATAARPRFSAYATAKCGLVRFSETLAAELAGSSVDVNSVAPGTMNTRMLDTVLASAEAAGAEYANALSEQQTGGAGPEAAAGLIVFLASADSDGITGRLISAVWDPWSDLPSRREDLNRSDVYTLRRIVPKDRGMTWGDR
jgi:NAD(P)-dependent dehydrogenase (short-subunit alcohol dehydrogenase family)